MSELENESIFELPALEIDPNVDKSFFKNPRGDFSTNPNAKVTTGFEDNRDRVKVGDGYDSQVTIETYDENYNTLGTCTGTYSTFEDFDVKRGSLVTTSGHCFADSEDGRKVAGVVVKGDFENSQGQYGMFRMQSDDFYVNENYDPENPNSVQHDTAIIQFDEIPPSDVVPAHLLPMNAEATHDALKNNDIVPMGLEGTPVISGGYSADKEGMTIDSQCYVTGAPNGQVLNTSCDGAQGSSGGGVFVRDTETNTPALNENGQPMYFATNSTGGEYYTGKTAISEDFLEASGYLEKQKNPDAGISQDLPEAEVLQTDPNEIREPILEEEQQIPQSNIIEGNFTGPDAAAEGDKGLTRQAEGAGFQTNLPAEVAGGQGMQVQEQTYAQNGFG